jgi:hypothetical protein
LLILHFLEFVAARVTEAMQQIYRAELRQRRSGLRRGRREGAGHRFEIENDRGGVGLAVLAS